MNWEKQLPPVLKFGKVRRPFKFLARKCLKCLFYAALKLPPPKIWYSVFSRDPIWMRQQYFSGSYYPSAGIRVARISGRHSAKWACALGQNRPLNFT
jgi:hypothetical protein